MLKDFWALEFSRGLYSDVRIKKKKEKGSLSDVLYSQEEREKIDPA